MNPTGGIPSPFVQPNDRDIIKKYFKGSDDLLLAMRAVMFDLDPTETEKQLVREAYANDELFNIIRYRFLPSLSKQVPIGQVQDIWLGIDQMLMGQSATTIEQTVALNEISIDMMKDAIELLRNPDGHKVSVASWDSSDPMQAPLLGRNRFIRAVETQILALKTVANQIEQAETDGKNSSR